MAKRPCGFGGDSGGGVSELETLPNMRSSGMQLSGEEGIAGRAGPHDELKAGTAQGTIAPHGMGSPRGGTYHCMGDGCGYKTRSKHGLKAHVASHKRHAMGSSRAVPSSSATSAS